MPEVEQVTAALEFGDDQRRCEFAYRVRRARRRRRYLRGVAVSTGKRTPALPNLPTAAEQGLKGYDANTNGGFLAPAGTSKAIINKLSAEINAALQMPDVRAKLEAAGIDIQGGTPQDYAALIKFDLAKWGNVVKEAGIQPD